MVGKKYSDGVADAAMAVEAAHAAEAVTDGKMTINEALDAQTVEVEVGEPEMAVVVNDTSGIENQTGEYVPDPAQIFYDHMEDVVTQVRTQSRLAKQHHMTTLGNNLEAAATKLGELAAEFKRVAVR